MRVRRESGDFRVILANTTSGTHTTIPVGLVMETFIGLIVEIGSTETGITGMMIVTDVAKSGTSFVCYFGHSAVSATYDPQDGTFTMD